MMDTGLRGKNALITGAGTGIGRAIALALAAEGVNIAIGSNRLAHETIREIKSYDVRAVFIPADVSKEADVNRMVEQALSELGTIDIFVNNAAITAHQAITRLTTDAWLSTMHTNLSACVWPVAMYARI